MKRKITFLHMPHSDQLEEHANQKLDKIEHILREEEEQNVTPRFMELWLKAQKTHPNNRVELHVKTPRLDLHAHEEGVDMYVVLDDVVDKMIKQIDKEKKRRKDKSKKVENEKVEFESDKYTLGD